MTKRAPLTFKVDKVTQAPAEAEANKFARKHKNTQTGKGRNKDGQGRAAVHRRPCDAGSGQAVQAPGGAAGQERPRTCWSRRSTTFSPRTDSAASPEPASRIRLPFVAAAAEANEGGVRVFKLRLAAFVPEASAILAPGSTRHSRERRCGRRGRFPGRGGGIAVARGEGRGFIVLRLVNRTLSPSNVTA